MSFGRRLTLVAAAATLLSSAGFMEVFDTPRWLGYALLSVGTVALTGLVVRALRAPLWFQPVAEIAAVLVLMALLFNRGFTILGVIPTGDGLRAVLDQVSQGFVDITTLAVPVASRPGLLLLITGGLGFAAVVVDLCAVGLRRAAWAGLPLLCVFIVPVVVVRSGLWWAFALGAAGFLWLQVTEHTARVRRWGHLVSASTPTQRAAVGAEGGVSTAAPLLAVAGILVAVLIPLGVPGLSDAGSYSGSGLGLGLGFGTGGGNGEEINPIATLHDELTLTNPYEMVRVRTDDNDPQYLRFVTLDVYGKNGWEPRSLSTTSSDRANGNHQAPAPTLPGVGTSPVHATVQVMRLREKFLPIYPQPTSIRAAGNWRYDPASDTVFATQTDTAELTYSFTASRLSFDQSTLAQSVPLAPDDPIATRFGRVSVVRPEVRRVLAPLVATAKTPFAKVLNILQSFGPSHGYRYTTSPVHGSSGDDVVDFLQFKQGFCVQYAGAMAYLVRAAGIPARVAVGFNTGDRHHDSKGDYWSMSTRDAHAWVEVYFNGIGWVPFDPTPSATPGRTSIDLPYTSTQLVPRTVGQNPQSISPPAPGSGAPPPNPAVHKEQQLAALGARLGGHDPAHRPVPVGLLVAAMVVGAGLGLAGAAAAILAVLRGAGLGGGDAHPDRPDRAGATERTLSWRRRVGLALLAAAVVVAVVVIAVLGAQASALGSAITLFLIPIALSAVACPALIRETARRRRLRLADGANPNLAADAAWTEVVDTLTDLGSEVDPSWTPRRAAEQLGSRDGIGEGARDALGLLSASEERARYAPRIGPTPGLRVATAEVVAAFRAVATRRQRVRAALLPRSVLRRTAMWATAVNERVAASVGGWRGRLTPRRASLENPR
jgi:transglutaminase-like putative cysteine protease